MCEDALVLVVDDEPQVRAIVCYVLDTFGYRFFEAADATAAMDIFVREPVDLVIADVMLPDGCGIDLCRRIRSLSRVPMVLLSALADEADRIAGLEAGADDYITKPFSPREVGLRVEAILRRQRPQGGFIEVGKMRLDPDGGVLSRDDQQVSIPTMESRVLTTLLRSLNRTVTFQTLLREVWNTEESRGGREMVRITVHRLRGHLRQVGFGEDVVETIRGYGYRIRGVKLL